MLKASDFRFFLGCSCYVGSSFKVGESSIAVVSVIEGIAADSVIANGAKRSPANIKPILRRFETLSRHELEELNKLWPHENIKRTTFGSIQLDADIINYLTNLHVDVFGWIDLDLAVDAAYNSNINKINSSEAQGAEGGI